MRGLVLTVVLLVVAVVSPLRATTVVLIQTRHDVILAADTLDTQFMPDHTLHRDRLCKIGQVGDLVFAVAGLGAVGRSSTDRTFDVPTTIRRAYDSMLPMTVAVRQITGALQRDFVRGVALIPESQRLRMGQRAYLALRVLLVRPPDPGAAPVVWMLDFTPKWDRNGVGRLQAKESQVPAGNYWVAIGMYDAITRGVQSGVLKVPWEADVPSRFSAVQQMVARQAAATPDKVALPIDAVRVTGAGVEWLTPKFDCTVHQ